MAEHCSVCDGTGYRIVERGGLSGAAPCECQLSARVESMMQHSCIPRNYVGCSFDNFDLAPEDPVGFVGLGNAVLTARAYVKDFSRNQEPAGVLFMGPPGSGKTHLAVALLRGIIGRGIRSIFLDCGHLLDQVKQSFGSKEGRAEGYRAAMEYDLVLLDDIGEASTDWARDTIQTVITHRYNNRLPTIVTTLLEDEALAEALGDRSASRLREMCKRIQLPLGTEDYREKHQLIDKRRGSHRHGNF